MLSARPAAISVASARVRYVRTGDCIVSPLSGGCDPGIERGRLPFHQHGAVVASLERLLERPLSRGNRVLREELLYLSGCVARAEAAERADDPRDSLERAQLLRQRRPLRLDEGPRRLSRTRLSEQAGDQLAGILRPDRGRDRELQRPLHERGIAERREGVEE